MTTQLQLINIIIIIIIRWKWVVNATLRPLYSQERPGNHCIGPVDSLGGCGKTRLAPGFHPRTVQPVASRYTD